MNKPLFFSLLRHGALIFISMLAIVLPAQAGNIFFGLSINGDKVTLTNQGNSIAYYPAVMQLHEDGHWQALALPLGAKAPAELLPGAQLDLLWPTLPQQQMPSSLEFFKPVMVRFFDQAGNYFGQISFFNQPIMTSDLSQSGYSGGLMIIAPPVSPDGNVIRASWLLWPQEEGIVPLDKPVRFEHSQPDAKHIEWQPGMDKLRLNLGAGLPSAILLHETGNGFAMQNLPNGGVQGVQQRAAWLDISDWLYKLAAVMAGAAVIVMLWRMEQPK